jgi:galactose mutarotase-like enzyme
MSRIAISCARSSALFDHEHGGTVAGLVLAGKQILFPDGMVETTSGLKRRGGIPLLFPNAGAFVPTGEFSLIQHGFARSLPWRLVAKTDDSARATLESTAETLAQYPYEFRLDIGIRIEEEAFSYELVIHNTGPKLMPVAPGLHPYFAVKDVCKKDVGSSIGGFDASAAVWPETLSYPHEGKVEIRIPGLGTVIMESSNNFKRIMVWSEQDADYLCVEPWRGEAGALQDPLQRLEIMAGEKAACTMVIRLGR